jgi:hypothetical protein
MKTTGLERLHLLIYILHWCAGLPVEASPDLKLQRLQGTYAAVGGLKLVLLLVVMGLLPKALDFLQFPCSK